VEFNVFSKNLKQHGELLSNLSAIDVQVSNFSKRIAHAMKNGGHLFICGNGGSAADSQHMASEFTGRFVNDRAPLPAIALTTDSSALTCISNDYSYDAVFTRQFAALAREGDILLAISTSGNSKNVINVVDYANEKGIITLGLLGGAGGSLAKACKLSIVVPSIITARIQEMHLLIEHSICEEVEYILGYAE